MKKIGKLEELAGTAGAFSLLVVDGKIAPVGTEVFIKGKEANDTTRFEVLVTAIVTKNMGFLNQLREYAPNPTHVDQVRDAIDRIMNEPTDPGYPG